MSAVKLLSSLALVTGAALVAVFCFRPEPAKSFSGGSIPRSVFSSKGVVNRVIEVSMKHDEVRAHAARNVVTVTLKAPFDLQGPLNYRWKLGEGVVLEEGLSAGVMLQLEKNNPQSFSIVVTGFGKESNRHIAFEVIGRHGGRAVSGDHLLASDPENTFENIVQNVERIKSSP